MNIYRHFVNDKLIEVRTGNVCPQWKMNHKFHKLRELYIKKGLKPSDNVEVEFTQAIKFEKQPQNNEQGLLLYMWEETIDNVPIMFTSEYRFKDPLSQSEIEKLVMFNQK